MMREEFEHLVGGDVFGVDYACIEEVYANLDLIRSKQHIATIYLRYGMDGIVALRRLVRGETFGDDLRRCSKMLSVKEMRLPNRLHRVIRWYDFKTGEVYDGTISVMMRYAIRCREWTWLPECFSKHCLKRNLNSILCDIAMRHPRMYKPCVAIARKFCI